MTRTMTMTTDIPTSREILVRLPEDVPIGAAHISLEIIPEADRLEDLEDIEDARVALEEARREGTVSLAQLKEELGF